MSTRKMAAVLITAATALAGLGISSRLDAAAATNDSYVQQQTQGPLDAAPTSAADGLVVIAHNAGDAASTIRSAVAHHVGVLEIDTSLEGTQLRARHDPTPRSPRDIVDRSQTVATAWTEASTPGILLDLKTSGTSTTSLVAGLVAAHPATRVIVSTHDTPTLAQIASVAPKALRLLSVATPAQLRAVIQHPTPTAVQGVSIANLLLTRATAQQLEQHHLWIQAWTVDTMQRADQLASWGVNGITTDNLTIIAALAPHARV